MEDFVLKIFFILEFINFYYSYNFFYIHKNTKANITKLNFDIQDSSSSTDDSENNATESSDLDDNNDNNNESEDTDQEEEINLESLKINEVMACPSDNNEWVELKNTSDKMLKGTIKLKDETRVFRQVYIVLGPKELITFEFSSILNNSSDSIFILDKNDNILDSFSYEKCEKDKSFSFIQNEWQINSPSKGLENPYSQLQEENEKQTSNKTDSNFKENQENQRTKNENNKKTISRTQEKDKNQEKIKENTDTKMQKNTDKNRLSRKTTNPKDTDINIMTSDQLNKILEQYNPQNNYKKESKTVELKVETNKNKSADIEKIKAINGIILGIVLSLWGSLSLYARLY